jgi:transposase-like protein
MDSNTTEATKPIPLVRRKRLSSEQRQEILARFHQGELTQQDFAAREGISVTTLSTWLRGERDSRTTLASSISFEELPQMGGRWAIEIVTPQNYTLRLAQHPEGGLLQQLLRALPC